MNVYSNFHSAPKAKREAIVSGDNYRFTILTERLFRYEWAEDGQFEDRASTFAINRDFPVPKYNVLDNGDGLEILTRSFHLSYDKKRFSASGLVVDLTGRFTLWGAQWRFGNVQDRGSLGGTARTLDGADGRIPLGLGVCSRYGYACIDDSSSMLFDDKGWVAVRRPGDRVDGYLFCYGHDYRESVKAYYAVSGSQPLLPRWSLGNWWSRFHPYSASEYIALIDKFRDDVIPLSVAVIDMDWHWVREERVTGSGWGGYSWNTNLFPDPPAFGHEMHKRGLKITANDHPHCGIHAFEDCYEEMAKFLGHDTLYKHPILFDPTNPRFMQAFFNIAHRSVERAACDFWWIDWQQGEASRIPGIDPLWMLNHFQFLDTGRDGRRSIIFSRFGGPGSHRYPVGFSGDTIQSWASLEFQPEFTSTASNVGYGWWSHDIGGHMGGERCDEMVVRWIEYGVFSPIFRLHSTQSIWQSKEPWLFRRESHRVIRGYMQLRHRLIPYLYSMNVRSATEGEPLIQPIYWDWPERDEAYSVPNQYFFGSELMVAPITKPRNKVTGLACVKVWFPPARRYVDILTGIVYDGNRALTVYRALDDIPVFAAEGSIIPLDANPQPKNGGLNPEAFEVLVIVGKDAEFSIAEDPKDDPTETKAKVHEPHERTCLIQYFQKEGKLSAKVTGRSWAFRFVAVTSIPLEDVRVQVNGKALEHVEVEKQAYPQVPSLVVKIPALSEGVYDVDIQIGNDPQLDLFNFEPRLFRLLLDYQCDFDVKDQIHGIFDPRYAPLGMSTANRWDAPVGGKVGQLLALGLDECLIGPAFELLLADSRHP